MRSQRDYSTGIANGASLVRLLIGLLPYFDGKQLLVLDEHSYRLLRLFSGPASVRWIEMLKRFESGIMMECALMEGMKLVPFESLSYRVD